MQVKCHRTIPALTLDQKVKGFSSMRKNALPMHLFILGLLWLFQVSLQGCLHFQHLSTLTHFPWWGLTALVSLYSSSRSTLPSAWGTTPSKKKNTYMEMQLKSLFLWIVQAVLRDSGRKCSARATWRGDGQRDEGPRWLRSTPSAFPIRKPPVLHPSLRHSVLIQRSKSDETHSHRGTHPTYF